MTWLTDKDREDQKRYGMDDNTPYYNFIFKDKDGKQFKVYLKNGTQYEWASKHNCEFVRIAYFGV